MVVTRPKQYKFMTDFELYNQTYIQKNIVDKHPDRYLTVKRQKGEGDKHYGLKQKIFDKLYERFKDDKKFFIFSELKQIHNPFKSELFENRDDIKYQFDIVVLKFFNKFAPRIIVIEVDDRHHYTKTGMLKDRYRDRVTTERYGIYKIIRVDLFDPELDYVITEVSNNIVVE